MAVMTVVKSDESSHGSTGNCNMIYILRQAYLIDTKLLLNLIVL